MDKGLYCVCGCNTWCIGESGIRCSKCYLFLPKDLMIDFTKAEQFLEALNTRKIILTN